MYLFRPSFKTKSNICKIILINSENKDMAADPIPKQQQIVNELKEKAF